MIILTSKCWNHGPPQLNYNLTVTINNSHSNRDMIKDVSVTLVPLPFDKVDSSVDAKKVIYISKMHFNLGFI